MLDVAEEDVAGGKGMSRKVFEDEYCMAIKHVENWVKKMKGKYGSQCEGAPFKRLSQYLMTSQGRRAVYACCSKGIPLEGTSTDNVGVPGCRPLVFLFTCKRAPTM